MSFIHGARTERTRLVSYPRFSTVEQAERSYLSRRSTVRRTSSPNGITLAIVVHHTSRFTRDATHARVVKKELRRAGVHVLSVTQELTEDPMGVLMEGFFECVDQYESEMNGLRTVAAVRVRYLVAAVVELVERDMSHREQSGALA